MYLVSKSAFFLHSQSYSQKLSYNGAISCIVIWLGVELSYLRALSRGLKGVVVNCYTYHLVPVNNAIYIQKTPQDLDHRSIHSSLTAVLLSLYPWFYFFKPSTSHHKSLKKLFLVL
ncbi:hypothetical protein EDC94DRAFT_98793 [Helicostylum pulchrum]|nr:hypothetical protein EDC94DRAFT_98793 [Helicostylum pulchrum]